MKLKLNLFVLVVATSAPAVCAAPDAAKMLSKLPLRFEPAPGNNQFSARGANFLFAVSRNQVRFHAPGKDVRLQFEGAAAHGAISGSSELRSKTNMFLGSDPAKWRKSIPNYARVEVPGLYPGVDLLYYGNAGELEYDLLVKPGADPRKIRMRLHGGTARLERNGDLISDVIQRRPVAYQIAADGGRVPVESSYRRNADGSFGFALGSYDAARELVIDPVLTLSQYLAGAAQDIAYTIGHDSRGLIYVAGTTTSLDFAVAGIPLQQAPGGGVDLFFTVIDPKAGHDTQVLYTSYLGGSGDETLGGMVVRPDGNVYLTGSTASTNFPTSNAAQTALSATTSSGTSATTVADAFVAWFDVFQTLLYSSYLGGTAKDFGTAIALDSKNRIWVTGGTSSFDFPIVGGFQNFNAGGGQDMFVAGIDPGQSGAATLVHSTYVGGTGFDTARGIAVASDGTIWMVGGTYSPDIALAAIDFQPEYSGGGDGYVVHLDPNRGANEVVYGTYLGSNGYEDARSVALDSVGQVIVSGFTMSSSFPTTPNAYQGQLAGGVDMFVSILNPNITTSRSGQLIYSTYFGGKGDDIAFDMKRDASGVLYLSGYTTSPGLPASPNALQSSYDGTIDAFALQLDLSKTGSQTVKYFSYLGSGGLQIAYGVDFDPLGTMYLTGFTSGRIFDALGGTPKGSDRGNVDAFVVGFPATAIASTQ